jgi:DNA-binding beta-propeller fold protein YncE
MNNLKYFFFLAALILFTLSACKKNNSANGNTDSTSTAFSLTTLTPTGKSFNTSNFTNNARDIELVGDSLFFVHSRGTNSVECFFLLNKGDLNSAMHLAQFDVSDFIGSTNQGANGHGIYIKKDDLSKMWLFNRTEIWEFDFEQAGDLTTVSHSNYLDLSYYVERGHGIFFNSEGSCLYVDDRNKAMVHQFKLANNWSISEIENYEHFSIANYQEAVRSIAFNNDGTKMFILDTSLKEIIAFNLTSPWQVVSASCHDKKGLTLSNPRGFTWNAHGTHAYVMNTDNGTIYEYAN